MPSSPKKIQANRENSGKSTGPKTTKGKQAVRYNALKHGLLAKEVVIAIGDGKENAAEFQQLLGGLQDEYRPVGVLEELLVQEVAACQWRKARALRAETGEIAIRTNNLELAAQQRAIDDVQAQLHQVQEAALPPDGLWRTALGVSKLLDCIATAKGQLAASGITAELRSGLGLFFGKVPFFAQFQSEPDSSDPPVEMVLKQLMNLERYLKELHRSLQFQEQTVLKAETARRALPSPDALHNILRYEARMNRELYRAIAELERLQSRREGETVPVPHPKEDSDED